MKRGVEDEGSKAAPKRSENNQSCRILGVVEKTTKHQRKAANGQQPSAPTCVKCVLMRAARCFLPRSRTCRLRSVREVSLLQVVRPDLFHGAVRQLWGFLVHSTINPELRAEERTVGRNEFEINARQLGSL